MHDDFLMTKKTLETVSPTFCAIKWKHTALNLRAGTMKTCCHHQFRPVGKSGKDLNDHSEDRRIRWELLKGDRSKECSYCWEMEDTGHFSDRIHWSGKPWMQEFVEGLPKGLGGRALSPSWLELTLSPTCNLKCSYCNPEVSSSWHKEVTEFGPYMTTDPHNDPKWLSESGKSPYKNESGISSSVFWDWFSRVIPQVRHLTLTGGEPLLAKETFDILEWLDENPQPDLEISLNSNCSVPSDLWNKLLHRLKPLEAGKIKSFYLHPSLDGWGEQAEYIRYGLKLALFEENVTSYLGATPFGLIINCTLNALSLPSFRNYWFFVKDLVTKFPGRGISSTVENVSYPRWQSTRIITGDLQTYFYQAMEYVSENSGPGGAFDQHTIDSLLRAEKHMKASLTEKELQRSRKDFYIFFKEHDRRRNTNFLKTFPEYRDFWRICEECYNREHETMTEGNL